MSDNLERSRSLIEKKKRHKAKEEEIAKRKREFQRAICETFATDSGKKALLYIMQLCNYQDPTVVYKPELGELAKDAMLYNEARRSVYLDLRRNLLLSPKILEEVEIYKLKGEI